MTTRENAVPADPKQMTNSSEELRDFFGWLMNHRRLARDYEALPARSEAMVHVAMISLMTRRLTGESTPTWRGT